MSVDAQTLEVTPDAGTVYRFSGFEGGNFAPETATSWTVEDADNAGFDYTVSSDQSWLNVLPQDGSVIGFGSDQALCSLALVEARKLAAGTYTAQVTFFNITNGQGNSTRTVELIVKPSRFTVSPIVVELEAEVGGNSPSPTLISLNGTGAPDLNYTVVWLPSFWLNVSKTSGTVPGNGMDTFSLNYSTSGLIKGTYTADVVVTNTTNGRGSTTILVSLVVKDPSEDPVLTLSQLAEGGEIVVQPTGTVLGVGENNVRRILFTEGQVITLTTEVDDGYRFVKWGGDLPLQTDETDNPITLTMDKPRSITAIVKQDLWPLHLSTSGGGTGTVKATPSGDESENALVPKYRDGQAVSLQATPDAGSIFTGWAGNISSGQENENPITVLMDRERTITARFEQVVDVAVAIDGEGTVTTTPDEETYYLGQAVTFFAEPASGYSFQEWTGTAASTDTELTLILDGDVDLTAVFAEGTTGGNDDDDEPGNPTPGGMFALSAEVEGQGVVTPASGEFESGITLRVVATPAVGWTFVGWDGDASGTTLTTDVHFTSDRKVIARFAQETGSDDDPGSPSPGAPMCGPVGAGMVPMMLLALGIMSGTRRSFFRTPRHRARNFDGDRHKDDSRQD